MGIEAYQFKPDTENGSAAQPDRDPLAYPEFRNFGFESQLGKGAQQRIPGDLLRCMPSKGVLVRGPIPPTAWLRNFYFCVRPEVKEIIEELEPGVHQFIPFQVFENYDQRSKPFEYFTVYISQRINEIDEARSDVRWTENVFNGKVMRSWKKKSTALTLRSEAIAGKHLWHNSMAIIDLMSGELHDRLADGRLLSGLELQKQNVV